MTIRINMPARTASVNAVVGLVDAGAGAGTLKIYTGSQPSDAAATATGTLLATVVLSDPSFTTAPGGSATANMADPASVNATASGTAGWFRVADSNGVTVFDGSISDTAGTGDLKLSSVTLSSGGAVDITVPSSITASGG